LLLSGVMSEARLLTFNWHETYLHMLAATGGIWDVVPRLKGGRSEWLTELRPLPANMRIVDEELALERLSGNDYDGVVCHNLLDLGLVVDAPIPTITVFHTNKAFELAHGLDAAAFARYGLPLLARSTAVFVSDAKRDSWGVEGDVIPPGVDLEAYGGWTGEISRVLHVGNLKRELASVNGMGELETAAAGLPFTLMGLNPTIRGARLSRDWDDLRAAYRSHRVYLHTTRPPYEDGYNLAMLEAMATGMPVVTLAHPTSPIKSGHNGLSGTTADGLRAALLELLEDEDAALRLGAAGRVTVREQYPIQAFRSRWQALIGRVCGAGPARN
jgi:glycosyltransferase involved in cell wall biosynthesis